MSKVKRYIAKWDEIELLDGEYVLAADFDRVEARIKQLEAECDAPVSVFERNKALEAELAALWKHCHVVYWGPNGEYPIEHNPHAGKDCRRMIEAALDSLSPPSQGEVTV